jgi:hypothetical protein
MLTRCCAVSFVDETEQIANGYEDDDEELEDFVDDPPSVPESQPIITPTDQQMTFGSPFVDSSNLSATQTDLTSPPNFSAIPSPDQAARGGSIILPPLHSITPFVPYSSSNVPTSDPFTRLNNTSSLFGLSEDSALPSPASSSNRDLDRQKDRGLSIYDISSLQNSFDNGLPTPTIYLDKAVWPLKDPKEALLLRHFVRKLAIWVCIANRSACKCR